jgi:hypothetical protein
MPAAAAAFAHQVAHLHGAATVWRPWLVGWLGAMLIGVANGIARGALYESRLGARRAQYVSTAALLILLTAYMAMLTRRWPLPTRQRAVLVGIVWSLFTVGFEFGLGRVVVGDSWSKLLGQYAFWRGNAWIAVPTWMAIGPAVLRRLRSGARMQQRV